MRLLRVLRMVYTGPEPMDFLLIAITELMRATGVTENGIMSILTGFLTTTEETCGIGTPTTNTCCYRRRTGEHCSRRKWS